jgi:hypothetical protein
VASNMVRNADYPCCSHLPVGRIARRLSLVVAVVYPDGPPCNRLLANPVSEPLDLEFSQGVEPWLASASASDQLFGFCLKLLPDDHSAGTKAGAPGVPAQLVCVVVDLLDRAGPDLAAFEFNDDVALERPKALGIDEVGSSAVCEQELVLDERQPAKTCLGQQLGSLDESALDLALESDVVQAVGGFLGEEVGVVVRQGDQLTPAIVGHLEGGLDEACLDGMPVSEHVVGLDRVP